MRHHLQLTMRKIKNRILLALLMASLSVPGINLYSQLKENNELEDYLNQHGLRKLTHSKENAYLVSDQLRADFNVKQDTFKHLSFKSRPFLREPASELLQYKEGLCGEGTRVLINLLARLGYDATRVTLYNRKLHASHTLVSVKEGNREYFVDSINSMSEVNKLLKLKDINTADFHVMKYIDDLNERKELAKSQDNNIRAEDEEFFFDKYWLYSYEAKPYSKIFSKLGMDVRAFNLQRPGRFVSSLAEKPYLISFFASLAVPLFIISIMATMAAFDRKKFNKKCHPIKEDISTQCSTEVK